MTTLTPPSTRIRSTRCLLRMLMISTLLTLAAASSSSCPAGGMILRVRLPDGTMEKIQVPSDKQDVLSVQDAVAKVHANVKEVSIHVGSSPVTDASMSLSALGLKHGSLITLVSSSPKEQTESSISINKKKQDSNGRWDPFPEIAKDYESALRKTKTRRSSGSGMSYADLAKVQSALHIVDPQPEGPLKRVYMCATSAARFQSNCINQKTRTYSNRVGLLLGTVSRERVDQKPRARTSLSSTTDDQKYCDVVKVHAVWEPPQQTRHHYDADALLHVPAIISQHARRVADWLGLRPVGWVFSYDDNRAEDKDALPMYTSDIMEAATLQIHNMKMTDREDGSRFTTLAMDAKSGATEAFQLSDVAVQMVAEDMILTDGKDGRFSKTRHEILVDGKETKQLDSVLCLVNTAMLSHEGSFSGTNASGNSVKKNGSLTNKARKAILKAMEDSKDNPMLEALCDFSVLLALDEILDEKDSERLCKTVQKWARGQKQGTELGKDLKLRLKALLEH